MNSVRSISLNLHHQVEKLKGLDKLNLWHISYNKKDYKDISHTIVYVVLRI